MKKWVLFKNNNGIYSICDLDYLKDHIDNNIIIIKELEGYLSYEQASKIYIEFLDTIFPTKNNSN